MDVLACDGHSESFEVNVRPPRGCVDALLTRRSWRRSPHRRVPAVREFRQTRLLPHPGRLRSQDFEPARQREQLALHPRVEALLQELLGVHISTLSRTSPTEVALDFDPRDSESRDDERFGPGRERGGSSASSEHDYEHVEAIGPALEKSRRTGSRAGSWAQDRTIEPRTRMAVGPSAMTRGGPNEIRIHAESIRATCS